MLWEWTGNRIICSLVNVGAEAIRPLATTVLLLPHPFVLLFSLPKKKLPFPLLLSPPKVSFSPSLPCLPLLLFSLTVTQGKGKQLRNYNTIGYNKKKDLEFEPFKNRGAVTFFRRNPASGSDFPSRDGSEEAKRPNRKEGLREKKGAGGRRKQFAASYGRGGLKGNGQERKETGKMRGGRGGRERGGGLSGKGEGKK